MEEYQAGACPLCASEDREMLWVGVKGARLMLCRGCGHIHTDVPPDFLSSHDSFQQAYPEDYLLNPNNEQYQFARSRVGSLLARKPALAVVVEVGSAYGHFLSSLPSSVRAYGVEPSAPEADFAQRHFSFTIIRKELQAAEEFLPMGDVDAVCSFHVLEHFRNPRDFFVFAQRCLGPKGALYLAVPDIITASPDLIELLFISNGWHRH